MTERIEKLISLYLQGSSLITEQQMQELSEWIKGDRENAKYFINSTLFYRSIHDILLNSDESMDQIRSGELSSSSDSSMFDANMIQLLLESEEKATEVVIERTLDAGITEANNSIYQKNNPRLNKFFRLCYRMISVAAVLMILFIIYANIFPPQYSVEVATVTDLMGEKWDTSSVKLKTGERIMTNRLPFKLEKGIIQFSYDEGVDIVIEGPAEFTIERKGIDLAYGRLYSYVSEIGHGFTVDTPNNRFIDLGTEFGVQVSRFGNSELHVMTGKVQLFAGGSKEGKKTKLVTEKEAILYESSTGRLKSIEFRAEDFARSIDSTSQFVWRGQNLNLADIIAGGNGLGSGTKQSAIDPANGRMIPWGLSTNRQGDGRYISVDASRFIDGVFVPDGGDGPITVSSEGHIWDAPDTTGDYKFNIVSSLRIIDDVSDISVGSSGSDVMLAQSLQGTKSVHMVLPEAWDKSDTSQHSSIFMHSNLGITYDLGELRRVVPGQKLSSFRSTFGVPEQYMRLEGVDLTGMHVDLWVLIDGEIRYSAKDINATRLLDIDIEIDESDSFLSLVVTQSIDGYKYDWGLFVDPVVKLESIK